MPLQLNAELIFGDGAGICFSSLKHVSSTVYGDFKMQILHHFGYIADLLFAS